MKEKILIAVFGAAVLGTGYLTLDHTSGYVGRAYTAVSAPIAKATKDFFKEPEKKETVKIEVKENEDTRKLPPERIAPEDRSPVLYYDEYFTETQRQLTADYMNFFYRAIKKHPKALYTENIAYMGKRPLLGDVFYHEVDGQIYRESNPYNNFNAELVTDKGDSYVFQSNQCKFNYRTEQVDFIKTEGPENKINYFMLPHDSKDRVSYVPDCKVLKLIKAQ